MRLPRILRTVPCARLARPALLAVVGVLALLAARPATAQECNLGATVCRQAFPKTGTCYLWECQQTGPLRQYVFTGRTCSCPAGRSFYQDPGRAEPRNVSCLGTVRPGADFQPEETP